MKSFKYTINGNVYKVHINSVVDDIAEVEVNGTPYSVKMEKPAKKQLVTLKRPAQAPTSQLFHVLLHQVSLVRLSLRCLVLS